MKANILVAHQSEPSNFQHEFDIEFIGYDYTDAIEEIVELLNDNHFRDCIFKIKDAPQNQSETGTIAQQPHGVDQPSQICPHCSGAGYTHSVHSDGANSTKCPTCGGSGKLPHAADVVGNFNG